MHSFRLSAGRKPRQNLAMLVNEITLEAFRLTIVGLVPNIKRRDLERLGHGADRVSLTWAEEDD